MATKNDTGREAAIKGMILVMEDGKVGVSLQKNLSQKIKRKQLEKFTQRAQTLNIDLESKNTFSNKSNNKKSTGSAVV